MCIPPMLWQEYCHHYGAQWLVSGANLADRRADFSRSEFSAFSAPLTWLLTSRSIPVPTPQEQRKQPCYRRRQLSHWGVWL
jgi:hypothetical protein